MKILLFASLLAAARADLPVADGFAGYERGGYEIQTGDVRHVSPEYPSAGQESGRFPGSPDFQSFEDSLSNDVQGQSGSSGEAQDNFQDRGRRQGQRGSQRFNAVSNNDGNYRQDDGADIESGGDLDDIPGEAGIDFPIYATIPKTSFRCEQQASPGYYADVETQCQVFHICQKGGQMDSVLCPNGTIFNQKVFVCSWWYDFDCSLAGELFSLNALVTAEGEEAAGRGDTGRFTSPGVQLDLVTSEGYSPESDDEQSNGYPPGGAGYEDLPGLGEGEESTRNRNENFGRENQEEASPLTLQDERNYLPPS